MNDEERTRKRQAVARHFRRWTVIGSSNPPPYVAPGSIKIEMDKMGDCFVGFNEVREDGSVIRQQKHYPKPMVDNLADPQRIAELETKLGLEPGYCLTYNMFLDIDPDDMGRINELMVQRCHGCFGVMGVYRDIQWRFKIHKIRCDKCAGDLIRCGESEFDAYFVE